MKTKCEIEWKPVSEPPDDEITILFVDNGEVATGFKDGDKWMYDCGAIAFKVSFWAHLPEPPK